jgi:uncharacterized RDD family membrane protein YckC
MKKSTLALLIVLLPALGAGLAQGRTPKAAPSDAASAVPPAAASAPAASERSDWEDPSDSEAGEEEEERAQAQSQSEDEPSTSQPSTAHRHRHYGSSNDVVNIGSDSHLPQGESADSVVAILGSSSVEGETRDAVSILGNTRVTGSVHESAVAVLGDVYVDGAVDRDVVSVMGNVELGPNAVVGHDVVAVGGVVHRDPAATVHGSTQSVGGPFAGFGWVHPWIRHCLLYGRPLAFADGLGWAWGCALLFLGFYLCLALLFRDAVTRCVETFETRPGMAVVAALLTVLLVPVLLALLFITIIGIAAIPFVVFGLLCVGLFGKAVMLAWIGRRCLKKESNPGLSHPAVAVLIGGLIVLVLYVVPVLGFLVYKVLGLLGLGAVVYTLIGNARAWRDARGAGGTPGGAFAAAATAMPGGFPAAGGVPPAAAASSAAAAPTAPTGAAAPAGAAAPPAATAPAGADAPTAAAAPTAASTEPDITAALPRAGFWIRMLALLLDALLVGFLMHLLHHMFNLELVMLAIYGAIMWKLRGSTIGGIVFDLHVVRLDGRPIDWETAIVRALGCFLSLAVAGLGFFWIAFDRGRQAWHDKIAGTAVVRVAKGVPLV